MVHTADSSARKSLCATVDRFLWRGQKIHVTQHGTAIVINCDSRKSSVYLLLGKRGAEMLGPVHQPYISFRYHESEKAGQTIVDK